jgi:hypothetical protein
MVDRISHDGDYDEAMAELPYAQGCANIVRTMKTQLGLDRMHRTFDSPDGTQVHVLDLEHQRLIHIIPPSAQEHEDEDRKTQEKARPSVGVPDYVSGFVSPRIEREKLEMPWDAPEDVPDDIPERPLIRQVNQTQQSAERIPYNVARYKLGVEESPGIPFTPKVPGVEYSEHAAIRPGFYSGAMRPLVQVLLGVGKVPQMTYERRWLAGDRSRQPLRPASRVKSAFGLYGEKVPDEVADEEKFFTVQVQWDYRFNRTHGISWGDDGKAYVVEIGRRGVFVYPLELDPVSLDPEGRARYAELYPEMFDDDGCKQYGRGGSFFDVFGGFPTGRAIGTAAAEAMIRAGEMVEALSESDMDAFYSKAPYSSVLGWAFHPRGGEAHNCCNEITGSHTHHGYHYCVTFSIGKYEEPEPVPSAQAVAARFSLSGWERRKALRMTDEQARSVLDSEDRDSAMERFDEITVEAPFKASARLRMVKKGRLWGRHPDWTPPFKVPMPALGEGVVVSFVMVGDADDIPDCDTPIFVCYSGDDLNVVNYFYRKLPSRTSKTESTQSPCQFGGEWDTQRLPDGEYLGGYFYSNILDWREMVPFDGEERLHYTMQGVGTRQHISFNPLYNTPGLSDAAPAQAWTTAYYQVAYDGSKRSAVSLQIGVTVPYGDRSIYYMAKRMGERTSKVEGLLETMGAHGGITKHLLVVGPYLGTKLEPLQKPPIYDPPPAWLEDYATGRLKGANGIEYAPSGTPSGEPDTVDACAPGIYIQPPYSTEDARWIPEGGRKGFVGHNGADYGDNIPHQGEVRYEGAPEIHHVVQARIFGDTHLHGELVNDEVLRYRADDPSPPVSVQGTEWMRQSPDMFGTLTVCAVAVSHFGKAPIINFNPDDGRGWRGVGGNEDMHIQFNQCYVGYIE